MCTIKAILRFSHMLLKIVIVAAAVNNEESRAFIEEEPVYWADNSELVYNEYLDVNLDIEILPPCDLKAFPPGFNKLQQEIDKLRLGCTKKYHEMFLLPLTGHYHCDYNERETLPFDTGNKNVSVKLALLVGYGSIYSFSSVTGNEDISKMKLGNVRREDLVKMVESKLLDEGSLEDLLELSELKGYHGRGPNKPRREYFSTLPTLWRYKNVIPEAFLQVIGIENFQKAFGDVLLSPSGNFSCSINLSWSNLKVTFSLPKVNRDLRAFHATPFNLLNSFEDFTCVLKYNGTQIVIWSTEQNCVVANNVTKPEDEKAFFTQSNSCIPIFNGNTPYFAVKACYKGEMQPYYYFSSKSMDQSYYVYCNSGFVKFPTEDDPAIPCPPFVFRTNQSLPIYPNGDRKPMFWSSDIFNTIIPESLTVNTILFPARVNTTAIMMSEIPIRRETQIIYTETFVLPPAAITMFIIMGSVILILILVAFVYVFRKFGFAVCTY